MSRNAYFILCVVGCTLLAGEQMASAQTAAPAPSKTPAPAQSVAEKSMTGILLSVDAKIGSLVIRLKSVDYPFEIDSGTVLQSGSGTIALADLKIGKSIAVTYRKTADNKRIAHKVTQAAAAAAPKAAAKKTAVQSEALQPEKPKADSKVAAPADTTAKAAAEPAKTKAPAANAKADTSTAKTAPAKTTPAPAAK